MEMDRRPPYQGPTRGLDVSLFDKVRVGLAESNTVGWDNAHLSIERAIDWYDTLPAKRFLKDLLHQVTSIMLDQVRGRAGGEERHFDSLGLGSKG